MRYIYIERSAYVDRLFLLSSSRSQGLLQYRPLFQVKSLCSFLAHVHSLSNTPFQKCLLTLLRPPRSSRSLPPSSHLFGVVRCLPQPQLLQHVPTMQVRELPLVVSRSHAVLTTMVETCPTHGFHPSRLASTTVETQRDVSMSLSLVMTMVVSATGSQVWENLAKTVVW